MKKLKYNQTATPLPNGFFDKFKHYVIGNTRLNTQSNLNKYIEIHCIYADNGASTNSVTDYEYDSQTHTLTFYCNTYKNADKKTYNDFFNAMKIAGVKSKDITTILYEFKVPDFHSGLFVCIDFNEIAGIFECKEIYTYDVDTDKSIDFFN